MNIKNSAFALLFAGALLIAPVAAHAQENIYLPIVATGDRAGLVTCYVGQQISDRGKIVGVFMYEHQDTARIAIASPERMYGLWVNIKDAHKYGEKINQDVSFAGTIDLSLNNCTWVELTQWTISK